MASRLVQVGVLLVQQYDYSNYVIASFNGGFSGTRFLVSGKGSKPSSRNFSTSIGVVVAIYYSYCAKVSRDSVGRHARPLRRINC